MIFNESKKEFHNICGLVKNKELDDQQIDAIVRKNRNQLIIAGAGSGKTTTIVGKVKYLLLTGQCKPEDILLLSFTNASASEMKERVKYETNIALDVMTFHKLGLEIIKKSYEKKNNDSFPSEQNDSLEREKSAKREEGYIRDDLPEGDNTNLFNCSNNTESDFPDQFAVNEEHNLDNDENQLHKNQIFASNQPLIHKNRGVKRVIIFYNDGSFDEFTHDKTERR